MVDGEIGHHCLLDAAATIDKLVAMIRRKSQAKRFRLDNAVERSAISNIKAYSTEARHFDPPITEVDERRHITERNLAHLTAFHEGPGVNLTSRHVYREVWIVAFLADQTCLDYKPGQRDDRMAAHRAVAFVVQEEDVKVGVEGRSDHRPVHIGMTARFPHGSLANMVIVLAK